MKKKKRKKKKTMKKIKKKHKKYRYPMTCVNNCQNLRVKSSNNLFSVTTNKLKDKAQESLNGRSKNKRKNIEI